LTCLDALRKTDLSRYMHREPISSEPPPARRQVGQDRSDDLSQPGWFSVRVGRDLRSLRAVIMSLSDS
jgi:hypothetical protein